MVAEATINKHATTLLNLYINTYVDKYGKPPVDINRYRDKWIFRNMFEDLGVKQAERVILYFFRTSRPGHPVKYLGNNYDRLNRILIDLDNDEQERLRLRKETEKRVREWEKKHGN